MDIGQERTCHKWTPQKKIITMKSRNNDNKKRNRIIDSWEAGNRLCSHTNSDSNNAIDAVMAGFQLKTKKAKEKLTIGNIPDGWRTRTKVN